MNRTRRAFLGTATAVVGVGLAGCLGGDPPEAPVTGDPDADVTVTVYEDFSCPYCRDFKIDVYPRLEAEYVEPGQIQYVHRDFPIPVDETWSWAVACAGREVYESAGDDPFFAFAHDVFEHQGDYSYEAIGGVADDLGLDGEAVSEAAEEEAHRSTIEQSRSYGESQGVGGTPTVLVDGERVQFVESRDFGTMAFEVTAAAIEDALQ